MAVWRYTDKHHPLVRLFSALDGCSGSDSFLTHEGFGYAAFFEDVSSITLSDIESLIGEEEFEEWKEDISADDLDVLARSNCAIWRQDTDGFEAVSLFTSLAKGRKEWNILVDEWEEKEDYPEEGEDLCPECVRPYVVCQCD